MPDLADLQALLRRIDGASYGAYKALRGPWDLGAVQLHVDRVQGDPFAAPSRVRVQLPCEAARAFEGDRDRREATEDWLLRRAGSTLGHTRRGSGKSGLIELVRPGPEVVERSALRLLGDGRIEARVRVGLPARGRRILGREAWALLAEDLPQLETALDLDAAAIDDLAAHVDSVLAQRALRRGLVERGLVGFIADGSVLPRTSGVDQAPLGGAVPFRSPPSLRVQLPTPAGEVTGMGVPAGVTVLVGGGFHGKSTVLQALQRGHLDHVPGDGREGVVALPDGVKIRAEDGRRVEKVDVSAFLGELPGGRSTAPFSTDDASGSTSQAAALVEAIEAGARLLLLDEDTSATNLLVREARMRALIPADREPITPLVERVRQLHADRGVSTVLVVGGVGDYLAAADTVILMDGWLPADVTERARELLPDRPQPPGPLPDARPRVPLRDGLAPGRQKTRSERRLHYGGHDLELVAIEQILDRNHAATLGEALRFLHDELVDGTRTLPHLLDALEAILDDEGVEALSPWEEPSGELVRPRRHEVAAALNRLRGLTVR